MTRSTDLAGAIGAHYTQQAANHDPTRALGSFAQHYADRHARLDQLADRANTDPAWFAGLPNTTRQTISTWIERRTNFATTNGDNAA